MTSNMNPNRKRLNTVAGRDELAPRKKESFERGYQIHHKVLNEDHIPLKFKRAGEYPQSDWVKNCARMPLRRFCCVCEKKEAVMHEGGLCRACGHESCPECLA
ncbi:hypothetical protein MAP00_005384 [Monascus purpureus]|nr:hypothetical protein MAP00_005384 [Monascus purpureus]